MKKPLLCSTCRLPFAVVENGVLVIESRHHGEKHTNVLSLEAVYELVKASHYAVREMIEQERTEEG